MLARLAGQCPPADRDSIRASMPAETTRLHDFQADGVGYLKQREEAGCGTILADEMGLGKTKTAVSLIAATPCPNSTRAEVKTTLIVVTRGTGSQWARELHGSGLHAVRCSAGMMFTDEARCFRSLTVDDLQDVDVIIADYNTVKGEVHRMHERRSTRHTCDDDQERRAPTILLQVQ